MRRDLLFPRRHSHQRMQIHMKGQENYKKKKKKNEDTKPMSAYREPLSPHMTQKAMTNKRTEDEM